MADQAAFVRAQTIVRNIADRGLSIYDAVPIGDPHLWLPAPELGAILNAALSGLRVDYPQRTRSKIVKIAVCEALGYHIPTRFKRTRPRFPGQDFDTYVQKSTNLQIWNEELSPTRRYVLIKVDARDFVNGVKVVTGDRLAELDTTGTLTQKYQARYISRSASGELLSRRDTPNVARIVGGKSRSRTERARSIDYPEPGAVRSISDLFCALSHLIGHSFPDRGSTQDRNRGGDLHRVVCKVLGYADFEDDGSCPDVKHQLLEIKLQTASTIDLGLVCPDSTAALDIPLVAGTQIMHRDVRYAVVGAILEGGMVRITNVYVVTGADFFDFFPQFAGRVLNKKLQIPLPRTFFEE